LDPITLTLEMGVVLGLLAFTVGLFVSEIIRIDLAAMLVMVLLGALSYVPGLGGRVAHLGAHRASLVAVADADGVLRDPRRDDDHGRLLAAHLAQRPDPDGQ